MSELMLNIITPKGSHESVTCDSIHLTICDNADGNSGGSYGIRPGHTKSLLSLDKGSIQAYRSGEIVLTGKSGGGFATIDHDKVTVVVEEFEKIK